MRKMSVKEILVPAVSLFLICVVITALLAVTNAVTAPKIDSLAKETEEKTKKIVLSTADSFSDKKSVTSDGIEYPYFEGLDSANANVGYVFLTSAKGYGGDISVMVGIDNEGKVKGVQILLINETAGLGMNAKSESFLSQFVGKGGKIGVSKGNPSETEIQALTGATITSDSMAAAVNSALSAYQALKEVSENG